MRLKRGGIWLPIAQNKKRNPFRGILPEDIGGEGENPCQKKNESDQELSLFLCRDGGENCKKIN